MAAELTVWRGDQLMAFCDAAIERALAAASIVLQAEARKLASVPNRGVRMDKKDLVQQARKQLGRRTQGLIRATTFDKVTNQDVTAWHYYNQKDVDTVKKSVTIYPFPALPGESPHVRTGFGQKSIVFGKIGPKEFRVGYAANARYMFFHEVGITYRQVGYQQRPTIIPALRRAAVQMRQAAIRAAQTYKAPKK